MSGQPAVLQVVILRDGLLVGTEVFVPGSYVLGSGPDADLVLDDGAVAAEHAFLYFQNGKAAVQDAGSPLGLYVNGHRVNACEIRPVDEVVVGPFVLKIRGLAQRPDGRRGTPVQPQPAVRQQPRAQTRPPTPAVPSIPPVGGGAQPRAAAPQGASARGRPPPATVSYGKGAAGRPAGNVAPLPVATAHPPPPPHEPPPAAAAPRQNGAAARHSGPTGTMPSVRRRGNLNVVPVSAAAARASAAALQMSPEEIEDVTVAASAADLADLLKKGAALDSQGHGPRLFSLPRKGRRPRLYFELYWHRDRQGAKSFIVSKKKPLLARGSEGADLALYGFKLGARDFPIARKVDGVHRIYIPSGARVERRSGDGEFGVVSTKELESDGSERFVSLTNGQAAKLSDGPMTLFAYVAPTPPRVWVNPLKGLPWLSLFLFMLFGGGMGAFIMFGPQPDDAPDFTAQNLPPVAVRLMMPEKKKPEEKKPEKKEEAKKEEKKPEKKEEKKVVVKHTPKPPPTPTVAPPPETAALKALKKIAAGPGTKDILAAMSKLGSGPGAKNNAFKLSGLLGKAPVAINGLGTGGLGGPGGGFGTKGAELLRGRGSGGIGALGVGSVGRGQVRGQVMQAVAHNVINQGNIDRDAVARTINSHFQEVRACYERALFKEPGLAGKVSLEWSISTAGKVVTAKTKSSSLRNGAVEACILSSLKTWQFPPAKGGVVIITYPFIFESKGF